MAEYFFFFFIIKSTISKQRLFWLIITVLHKQVFRSSLFISSFVSLFILTNGSVSSCLCFKHFKDWKLIASSYVLQKSPQTVFPPVSLYAQICHFCLKFTSVKTFLQILSGAQNTKTQKQNIFSQIAVNCSLICGIRYWVLASQSSVEF